MRPGRHPILSAEQIVKLREWYARPRGQRPALRVTAELLGVSYSTAKRGASGTGYYARVQP
jgi:hypothetical protein